MCLNLKAKQPLGQMPPLAFDVNAACFKRVMRGKVVVYNFINSWQGKPVQAAEPAACLISNRASNNTGAYYSKREAIWRGIKTIFPLVTFTRFSCS